MKCKFCMVEMLVDSVEEKENRLIFHYKCPNKSCENYGYGDTDEKTVSENKQNSKGE